MQVFVQYLPADRYNHIHLRIKLLNYAKSSDVYIKIYTTSQKFAKFYMNIFIPVRKVRLFSTMMRL